MATGELSIVEDAEGVMLDGADEIEDFYASVIALGESPASLDAGDINIKDSDDA